MTQRVPIAMALCVALGPAPAAWAQRVQVRELFSGITGSGARALGMGGAFIAVADDATAASWNPAGLCVLEKPEAAVSSQAWTRFSTQYSGYRYAETFRSTGPGNTSSTDRYTETGQPYDFTSTSRAFDFASFTYTMRMGSMKLVPQLSYQRVVDLGPDYDALSSYSYTESVSTTIGPSTSTSNFTGGGDEAQTGKSTGGIDLIATSVGVSLTEKVYFGLAVNFWRNGSDSTGSFNTSFTGGGFSNRTRALEESFKGTSLQAGVIVKPTAQVSLGLVYKHPFDMDYTYRFTSDSATSRTVTARDGTIRWPRTIGAGIAVKPTDLLTLSLDYTQIQWSKAKFTYVQTTTITRLPSNTVTSSSTTNREVIWPRYYDPNLPETGLNDAQQDAQQIRLGVEYVIRKPNFLGLLVLPVRAGFIRDGQINKRTSDLSKLTYNGVTVGFGLVWSRLSLDFAYVRTGGSSDDNYTGRDTFTGGSDDYSFTRDSDNNYNSQRFLASTVLRF